MKKMSIILLALVWHISLFSQTDEKAQHIEILDKIFQLQKPPITPTLSLPIITIGTGLVNYHGDIPSQIPANFSTGTPAAHIMLSQTLNPYFNLGLFAMRGTLTGSYSPTKTNHSFNFKTDISSFGTIVHYNLGHIPQLRSTPQSSIHPYIGLGIECLQRATPKGDLYNDTLQYFQWKDGTQRTIQETNYSSNSSEIVYRDYTFETAYEQNNTDGIPYYKPITISFPIDLGIQLTVNDYWNISLGYQYHITSSDVIDNISTRGIHYDIYPERKGNGRPDAFSYAYLSVSVQLHTEQHKMWDNDSVSQSALLEFWDADNDGIDETMDECPYTPKGVAVYANGCPIDDDRDGVANFEDLELYTRAFFVTQQGIGISEKDLLNQMKSIKTVEQREIYRFYPKLLNGGTVYKQFYKKIPWKYKPLDVDKNEYIDLDEMLNAIDTFFDEGPNAGIGSNLAVKDLFELIEFFFLQ